MSNISFVHTYWSKPAFNKRWSINTINQILCNIWYYSLSVAYLKRLNQKINLYTDDFGKQCLDHIPYDSIHTTLNSIPPTIKPYMWAYGKFWALKDCSLDAIHIDGDVFIKTKKCVAELSKKCDLLVQCKEFVINKNQSALYMEASKAIDSLKYPEFAVKPGKNAYNTGVVKFGNEAHKQLFLKEYFLAAERCSISKEIAIACKDKNIAPDLIIEQQFMYDSATYLNLNVKRLITWTDANRSSDIIGFQHVIGRQKYESDCITFCKKILEKIDPALYAKTKNKCKTIETLLKNKKFVDNLYEKK